MNAPGSIERLLEDIFNYYGKPVTEFEGSLWMRLVEQYGEDSIRLFLMTHIGRSTFAPKINEAMDILAPGANSAPAAFLELSEVVRLTGHWDSPTFSSPVIVDAVIRMGGWAQVAQQMPAPGERFEYESFRKRFEVAYQVASATAVVKGPTQERLLGQHAIGRQQILLANATVEASRRLGVSGKAGESAASSTSDQRQTDPAPA